MVDEAGAGFCSCLAGLVGGFSGDFSGFAGSDLAGDFTGDVGSGAGAGAAPAGYEMTTIVRFCLSYDPLKWNLIDFKMTIISIRSVLLTRT